MTIHSPSPAPRAAYIHVPFCRHRCGYCNFTLVAGRDDLIGAYLDALERELSSLQTAREVDTLFLGGGTPTHLSVDQLRQLLRTILRWFPLASDAEFSVEANPVDIQAEKIGVLAEQGVNRLSLGVQSFADEKLATLERDHRREQIDSAVRLSRESIDSVALDLIFGVPGETRAAWQGDLEAALRLGPDHMSTYGLTFERGTSFWTRRLRQELAAIDEEDERWMYETAIEMLVAAGFEHYEVSNFAQPAKRCRHNENYWLGGGYYAAGPGAASFIGGTRSMNHRSTTTYIQRLRAGHSPIAESETLGPEDAARERLVFGLRRLEGVARAAFSAATGFDMDQLVGAEITRLVQQGLLDDQADRVRLTRTGLLLSDAIWPLILRV